MTGRREGSGAPRPFTDEELARIGDHLTELRRWASEPLILYWTLGFAFVVGLAAHVVGYLVKTQVTTQPLGLVGDLLYTFGWALWTGVLVVLFVQVVPEAKRRQLKRGLEAYEATRERAGAGSARVPEEDVAPTAK